jgi:hypothetical protein
MIQKNPPLTREEISVDTIISVRKRKRTKIWEKYRIQQQLFFDKIKYNTKNITKTTFSVAKRKLEEALRARKFHNQVK